MRSSSSSAASCSSSSTSSSQYFSADSSPRAREEVARLKSSAEASSSSGRSSSANRSFISGENSHDEFNSFREEDARLKSPSSPVFSSSLSSSSQSSSANRSSNARENTDDLLIRFREEDLRMKSSLYSSSHLLILLFFLLLLHLLSLPLPTIIIPFFFFFIFIFSSFSASSSSSNSSSANPSPSNSHDVFISFRGEDTRKNFVSHLLPALIDRRQIRTYMDCDLQRGNEISSTILRAIQDSKISLIVFSEKYANSSWTLDELVEIMECKRSRRQHVIPIFYQVSPTDVRHQTGTYGAAFKDLKRRSKSSMNKTVQQWTNAMTEVAKIAGWDSSNYRSEYELVELIASEVKRKLESMISHGSEREIQQLIGSEVQAATLIQADDPNPSHNFSAEPNSVGSQDDSVPSKCLSQRLEYELVEAIASEVKGKQESMISHGSEREIQQLIGSEVQALSLIQADDPNPSHNCTVEPNLGGSQDDFVPSKGLPQRGNFLVYLGEKTRDAFWRKDNEDLVLTPGEPSSLDSPKLFVYRNRYVRKRQQKWWGIG